ncbi:hypothetical protein TRFO_26718 [Tritrichomonas foetus]|uniref:Uncharacterized protein n=1 Tax=Tritrichomonas foetus TaxID=1144522 RepID=A0A1J4K739_9EUKA|nr:hypothetical protein TRFO_26718 [Tritrichomonas foetus]|eukprot:OHT05516.1 hypothetical protein TRFO_26718 [Tritrichomonas foetus]
MQQQDTTSIFLHGIVEQMMFVDMYDTPSVIAERLLLPINYEYLYVSKGRILSPLLSLGMQGISKNDDIYVVQRKSNNKNHHFNLITSEGDSNHHDQILAISKKHQRQTEDEFRKKIEARYGNRFKDTDTVYEQMFYAMNPKTTNEFARLTDLFKMKVESNTAAFRRICKNIEISEFSEKDDNQLKNLKEKDFPTVVPQKAHEPSTDFMPIILPDLRQESSMKNF